MSRSPAETAADILLNPGMVIMVGVLGYMLFTVIRAATAGGRDRTALSSDASAFPVVATFAGLRGLPSVVAVASNSARPLFAIGPRGIEYRVMRKHVRSFADIENIDVRKSWKTVNIEFQFRGDMLTLAVNAGTELAASTILKAMPDSTPLTPRAAALRA